MSRGYQTLPACAVSGEPKGGTRRVGKRRNRVKLVKEHERIWKDVLSYPTNQDAATAISAMLPSAVQVQTVRRRFGPSGRGTGRLALASGNGSQAGTASGPITQSHRARHRESQAPSRS